MTDPIANFFIQIKNGYMAEKEQVVAPFSKMKYELAKLLAKDNYIQGVKIETEDSKKYLKIQLKYKGKVPAFSEIVRISKPGRRVYVKKNEIPQVLGGLGITVLSTPEGIVDGKEAKKKGLGGELLCKLW